MKKHNKIILISAGASVVTGIAIFAAALHFGGVKMGNDIQHRTETIPKSITALDISVQYEDIEIISRDTDEIKVYCTENARNTHNIGVSGKSLIIAQEVSREKRRWWRWYNYINFDFLLFDDLHKLIIEVPRDFNADIKLENSYGDVKALGVGGSFSAKLDYGDMEINDCDFSTLECRLDYGDIKIENTNTDNIRTENDCGDTELKNVTGSINAYCDLGDIEFENISGDSLIFENNCGDIEGNILGSRDEYSPNGSKKLEAKTDLGDVDIKFKQKIETKQ